MGTLPNLHPVPILSISLSTNLAYALSGPKGNLLSTLTNPSLHPPRIPIDQGIIRYILCYNRTGSNEGILSNPISADDRGIGSNGRPLSYQGLSKLFLSRDETAGIKNIRKNHRGTTKDIILQNDSIVEGDIVLNLNIIP